MQTERLIGRLCAPALAGIKPSNLVSIKKRSGDEKAQVMALASQLRRKNIRFKLLRETEERLLFLIYRPDKLRDYLRRDEIKSFLASMGYPEAAEPEEYIERLISRLKDDSFPHEIGAFLGYPIEDIRGFMGGRETFLMIGEWKVYANEEKARRTFARYRSCREAVMRRLVSGNSLAQIFCAA